MVTLLMAVGEAEEEGEEGEEEEEEWREGEKERHRERHERNSDEALCATRGLLSGVPSIPCCTVLGGECWMVQPAGAVTRALRGKVLSLALPIRVRFFFLFLGVGGEERGKPHGAPVGG